jgi:GT2 family glycosyltransferase
MFVQPSVITRANEESPAECRADLPISARVPEPRPSVPLHPVRSGGKFFSVEGEPFPVRGVSYGPFAPEPDGCQYHTRAIVDEDFDLIAASGFNVVRTYTAPPLWLLDAAAEHGLRLMVGLAWEQHVDFLADRRRARDIRRRVADGVASCANHPAIFGYAVGNEIPAPVVRWYGARPVEKHLRDLYLAAKDRAPDALVTYVNYPSTEYLELPFLDFVSFNVYLESRRTLRSYVSRLQNIAGDRPLLMAEVGLDSARNGEAKQARVLRWQLRTLHRGGCAGTCLFAWTDEWHRGGAEIDDWKFGLTRRDRTPKPALRAVEHSFASDPDGQGEVRAPVRRRGAPPLGVSVVVCTYNGSRTLANCLSALGRVEYPQFEVIVVDDGSTDRTPDIAREFDVRLIRTENRGLSSARNTGLTAAKHEIVAYVDDDAAPHPLWLRHLVDTFTYTRHAGVGGPNVPPTGVGLVESAVSLAPGGPIHVLLDDETAEHIPGCNMAFRRDRLNDVGGFDPQFRIAGDDVDACWRLQENGWTLGFNPAAMVWHRRRHTIRGYWRQQVNYGKAEADLERKWPRKYNAAGHLSWAGRLYANGLLHALGWQGRGRIYQGMWGSAPFQSANPVPTNWLWSLPLMPEWYLLAIFFAVASAMGAFWRPMLGCVPLLGIVVLASILFAISGARRALGGSASLSRGRRLRLGAITALLYLLQPAARLWGRLNRGLTPWRRRGRRGRVALPIGRTLTSWVETWQSPDDRLRAVERALAESGAVENRGGAFDRWDIEVRGGMLGSTRLRLLVEEHGQGKQLARYRIWSRLSSRAAAPIIFLGSVSGLVALTGAWEPAALFGVLTLLAYGRAFYECAASTAVICDAVARADAGTRGQCKTRAAIVTPKQVRAAQDDDDDDDAAADFELGTP